MPPFALHNRLQGFVSLLAAAITSLSILGGVVYLFVAGDTGLTAKSDAQLARAASPPASAAQPAPVLAGTHDAY